MKKGDLHISLVTQFSQIYTNDIIHKLYLSPYAGIFYTKSGAYLKNSVNSQKYFLPGKPSQLKKLFDHLSLGIEYSRLAATVADTIQTEDASLWITEFMQKGIIE